MVAVVAKGLTKQEVGGSQCEAATEAHDLVLIERERRRELLSAQAASRVQTVRVAPKRRHLDSFL